MPFAAISDQIRSDQSLSRVRLFATPWIAARQASLSNTNSGSSLRLTSSNMDGPKYYLSKKSQTKTNIWHNFYVEQNYTQQNYTNEITNKENKFMFTKREKERRDKLEVWD